MTDTALLTPPQGETPRPVRSRAQKLGLVGEIALMAWSVVQVGRALVWFLSVTASNAVLAPLNFLEEHGLGRLEALLLPGLRTGPIFSAPLESAALREDFDRALTSFTARQPDSFEVAPDSSHLEINLGWSIQAFDMTRAQEVVWVLLHVVPLLVLAVFWWQLTRVVRRSRTNTPFTARNAHTLSVAGLVLVVGAPLLDVLRWRFEAWTVETSQLADEIRLWPWGLEQMPWTAVACGVALVAVAQVWRRGVALEDDARGLV